MAQALTIADHSLPLTDAWTVAELQYYFGKPGAGSFSRYLGEKVSDEDAVERMNQKFPERAPPFTAEMFCKSLPWV